MEIRRFGPKREEGTGDWRVVHGEEHRDLCFLSIVVLAAVKEDEMGSEHGIQGKHKDEETTWKTYVVTGG